MRTEGALGPSWLRHPVLWLLAQAVLVFLLAARPPALVPAYYPSDSYEYLKALDCESWEGCLSSRRTLGYPLLLALVQRLPAGLDGLPLFQLGLYLLAVVAFGGAAGLYLNGAVGAGWSGLLAATPLFYSRLAGEHAASVLADVPASAFAVVTFAGLLWWAARPASRWALAVVGVSLVATYQTRPAYLFLLVLVPLMGLWLASQRLPARAWGARLAVLATVALTPFLLWCSLRAAVTGHFGLVSFGGTNLVGIAVSCLTPELVPRLPAEHRELAQAILARRGELGVRGGAGNEYRYRRWARNYNRNIWLVALPVVRGNRPARLDSEGSFWVEANHRLSRFSWAVIRQRPGLYVRWLWDAVRSAASQIAREPAVRWPALLLLGLAGLSWLRRRVKGLAARAPSWWPSGSLSRPSWALIVAASAYAAAGVLLACLVEPPVDRYWLAASLFLPAAFAAGVAELVLPRAGP